MSQVTGHARYCDIDTMGENQEKVEQNKVAIMPYDFIDANQPWFYVISPRHYEAFLTKEELLNTPCFQNRRARKWSGGDPDMG